MELKRTGRMAAFLDIGIGAPFYAHKKYWVRTDYDAATELASSDENSLNRSCCNFLIDGTVSSVRPESRGDSLCEEIEIVEAIMEATK